ncbi:glycosyltransferase [Vibrio artabrorum]|uniref:glycosyltransferase n=1 Tax=Vibrio artabrorum TaxID=446374 RepID=UPI00354B8B2B
MTKELHIKPTFILCIYSKDKPNFISSAIESCINQTINCNIYIYVDGKVGSNIKKCLESYALHESISIFRGENNRGLAFGLNFLIEKCLESKTKYIFRMDADDISVKDRVAQQLEFFENNSHVDVVGSDVIEIDDFGNETFYKSMESDTKKIYEKIIKKCPLNHPSVAFRRGFFEMGLRYNDNLKNTQDYYLWVDALDIGVNLSNINRPLLYFRVDKNFHQRRGLKKAINDVKSRLYAFQKLNVRNTSNYIHVFSLFILRISPPFVKKYVYKRFR